jgi:hypothetical protein
MRWYASLALICVVGVALFVFSRYQLEHPTAANQPTIGDKWYTALAFDVCGKLQPNLPANPTSKLTSPQIFTEGDGIIRTEPTTDLYTGNNATFGRFVAGYKGLSLTSNTLKLPGHNAYVSGNTCPKGTRDAGQRAYIQVRAWPSFYGSGANQPQTVSDPTGLKLANGQEITVAYVRQGASIPKPARTTVATLASLYSGVSTSTTLPTATTAPSTATTAPTTATTAPSTATTAPTTATTAHSSAATASSSTTAKP